MSFDEDAVADEDVSIYVKYTYSDSDVHLPEIQGGRTTDHS